MSLPKMIWALLFRLFPCPTPVGLSRVGHPTSDSPVLVTCNFYLTVRRLRGILDDRGIDAWLLVADSKGVNVWCAAGGDELNTHSVVSVVKTTEVAQLVGHRTLILPPLAAPGVLAAEVRAQTGWATRWGPVRATDLPRYLDSGLKRSEDMKRVTYEWRERLDTALGALFPFYFLGAVGFLLFARDLILNYLLVAAIAYLLFFLSCPWLPGKRGLTKVAVLEAVLAGVFFGGLFFGFGSYSMGASLIIAMIMLLIYGTELGGLASTLPSDLDPFLARLGLSALGNVSFAGTVRTELLNGYRELCYDRGTCIGCRCCYEVCPVGVWLMIEEKRAVLARPDECTACRACLVQCPTGAIRAPLVHAPSSRDAK
ncbi:MAG: 4Fe-4S binding protein [Deltaproteobacteria bacterium]